MGELVLAARRELFKVRRMRLMWTLAGVLGVFVALNAFLSYQGYQDVRRYLREELEATGASERAGVAMRREMVARALRANLVLPSSYAGVTGILYFPGFVLITVAAAYQVGGEFGWGTVQRLLARGRRRAVYVAAKLVTVVAGAAGLVVIGMLLGTLAGLWTSRLVGAPLAGVFGGSLWSDLATVSLRLWLVLSVYGFWAAAVGFGLRSVGMAVAVPLIYYFVESLASALIIQPRGWLVGVRPYLLGNAAHALVVTHNPFVSYLVGNPGAMTGGGTTFLEVPAAWWAVGIWGVGAVALSFLSFLRRDLTV